MHLYVKHATLINNCYPEKEGEKGPRSSELSYLVFYASSRPVKLTKVGLFLEKKVERDVAKSRRQNNQVSLDIIKSLIQACHRDLNLFSKYIVKILEMVLETKDIELVDLCCEVFIVFTNYHDGSTLGVDAELTSDYELLLKKFAGFCLYENKDETLKLKMRYIGQRALQAAANSLALQSSDYKTQLAIILPPLLTTLSNSSNPANALAQSDGVDIRQSATTHETLNAHTVDVLAAKTTGMLFGKANGVAVRFSLSPIFTFMDKKSKWSPCQFAVSIMELVLDSLQSQYRYLLISEMLQQLENEAQDVNKKASLVSILDALLNANIPLVGISVLEVLNALFSHLITAPTDEIQQGLIHSIGGLGSQTYYHNQLNDITAYIVSKLRVGAAPNTTMDGMSLVQYRKVVLQCLVATHEKYNSPKSAQNNDTESSENVSVYGNLVTLEAWIPALGLLLDPNSETRADFAGTLVQFLDTISENEIVLEPYPKHTLNNHGDILLVNAAHQKIIEWVQLDSLQPMDIQHMYKLLTVLTRKFGADETIKAVPLVFEIQALSPSPSKHRANAALVVEWLLFVGDFYRIERLIQYAEGLKEAQSDAILNFAKDDVFDDGNQAVPSQLADRKTVVEILSKDGPLRDEDDAQGTDLETKLMVEWGTDAYENQDRSFRIRTSRNLSDLKAKLAMPWTNTEFTSNGTNKKDTIKVENLKEALAAQTQNETTSEPTTSKRISETVTDMSSLLQSLSLGNDASNTTSLVNPPYKA